MKKTVLAALLLALACFTACGEDTQPTQNTQATKEPAQTATEEPIAKTEATGYVFRINNVDVAMDAEAAAIIAAIGDPKSYSESTSCAFDGLDKIYDYGSYEIDVYSIEGETDKIASVYFYDDLVSTTEGVSINMTRADMEKVYGTEYSELMGSVTYEKGNSQLIFLLKDDEIISIQYVSKSLN